jgi:hypothetical protein
MTCLAYLINNILNYIKQKCHFIQKKKKKWHNNSQVWSMKIYYIAKSYVFIIRDFEPSLIQALC